MIRQRRTDHSAACRFRSRFRADAASSPSIRSPGYSPSGSSCSTARRRPKRPLPAWSARTSAFEPLVGEAIDIGEAVAQEFSLALPPFPRSPEIRVETETEPDPRPRPLPTRLPGCCGLSIATAARRETLGSGLRATTLPGFARCTPSLLPQPRNLAKYRHPSRSPFRPGFAAERYEERSSRRDNHGCSEKENLALAPQHAAVASRAERAGLCRMPGLRRAEAAASPLPVLRPLRRARGHAAAGHDDQPDGAAPARRTGDAVNGSITIAVDAMGGDRAPAMVLQGRRYRPRARPRRAFPAVRRRSPDRAAAGKAAAARGRRNRAPHARRRARRRQAVGGVALRTPIQHAAGDRCGRGRTGRLRRFRRQHRRADGDGQIRAEDAAGHRPPGDRRAVPDPARRKRACSISAPMSNATPRIWCSSR